MTNIDFSKKKFWLFDLDNTIYSPNTKIFDQIDMRMKKYISKTLNISQNEAFKIQKKYYKEFGTTLYGLMQNHNIDPDDFLDYVHNVNLKNLEESSELIRLLSLIPGKKIIYTNGDERHAQNVLFKLKIDRFFEDIFDIRKGNLIPKPNKNSLIKLINHYSIDPSKTVYFEDIKINLRPAYSMGITTILIDNNKNSFKNSYVDYSFNTLISALSVLGAKFNKGCL